LSVGAWPRIGPAQVIRQDRIAFRRRHPGSQAAQRPAGEAVKRIGVRRDRGPNRFELIPKS
jgi:hypothetical protein